MSDTRTIPGGEAATHQLKNDTFTKLFKPGVRFLRLKKTAIYFVKVLPAFNPAIAKADPGYKTGFVPYRAPDGNLTSFVYKVLVCRGIGPQGMDFFSPKTFGPGEMCLIEQLFVTAKSLPAYKHMTEFATGKPSILSSPAEVGLMNIVQPHKPDDGVRVLMLPNSGTKDFVAKVNLTRDLNQPPVQAPFGDRYQWGDITDLTHGLVMSVKAVANPQSGFIQYECDFQQFPGAQGAGTRMLYPCTSQAMFDQMMSARYDIPDVLNIMAQAELLEYLNSVFPRPLIEAAFGSMYALPPMPVHATHTGPPAGGWPAGPAAAPAPAPGAPAPAAWPVPAASWPQGAPAAPPPPTAAAPAWLPATTAAPAQPWAQPATSAPAAPAPTQAWPQPAPAAAPVAPPAAWQQPVAAPAAPAQTWVAPVPPPAAPAGMAPAATLPSPGSMPTTPPPPTAMTTLPGADEIKQDQQTGRWEGFPTRELAVEYRRLSSLFQTNPDAARDMGNLQKMTELIKQKQ